jgi:hypothetical protein
MEVEPTSFLFSRLSPSLCVLKPVSLCTYLCTTNIGGLDKLSKLIVNWLINQQTIVSTN